MTVKNPPPGLSDVQKSADTAATAAKWCKKRTVNGSRKPDTDGDLAPGKPELRRRNQEAGVENQRSGVGTRKPAVN